MPPDPSAAARARWAAADRADRLSGTEAARREHRYRAAETRVRKIVDGAPPLTPEQLTRLAAILAPAADGAA